MSREGREFVSAGVAHFGCGATAGMKTRDNRDGGKQDSNRLEGNNQGKEILVKLQKARPIARSWVKRVVWGKSREVNKRALWEIYSTHHAADPQKGLTKAERRQVQLKDSNGKQKLHLSTLYFIRSPRESFPAGVECDHCVVDGRRT